MEEAHHNQSRAGSADSGRSLPTRGCSTAYETFENKQGILLLGCWVHARRYFERALGNDKARAEYALAQIARLYTMMGCCKAARADFRKWTTYFLNHIHEYDSDYSRPLDDFLPATLKERGLV